MVSSVVVATLDADSTTLGLSILCTYAYYQLWAHWVAAKLTTSTLGRSMQHINPFYLSKSYICHEAHCVPGQYLCYDIGNLLCFLACVYLAAQIWPVAKAEIWHALSYFLPNTEWVYKDPDLKWVADHECQPCVGHLLQSQIACSITSHPDLNIYTETLSITTLLGQ